jgi:hypothetical protein
MILTKHEERIPMKLFKTLCSNALMFIVSVLAVLLTLSVLGQALALGFYALLLTAVVGLVAFLYFRRPT